MEIVVLVIMWPLILLTLGVVFISASDVAGIGLVFPMVIVLIIFLFALTGKLGESKQASSENVRSADHTRRAIIAFSMALLLPIFVKYFLGMMDNSLVAIILGLVLGFGVLVWGMFLKNNRVLTYANILGGGLVIVYLYFQLWSLGQLAQVIASAFGLVAAIGVSLIKFKDKLS